MSVVSRLCTKMEPHEDSLGECVECLSSLLSNGEDQVVADGALKCFASLADRFIRKNVDPVPLASNGLTQELLNRYDVILRLDVQIFSNEKWLRFYRLATAGLATSNAAEAAKSTTASVSTTISLLSTLCRGSEAITHSLLRSNLAEAIESALQGDERCILDTMRLIDLLLVLLFEGKSRSRAWFLSPKLGQQVSWILKKHFCFALIILFVSGRQALPKSSTPLNGGRLSVLRRLDSKLHFCCDLDKNSFFTIFSSYFRLGRTYPSSVNWLYS